MRGSGLVLYQTATEKIKEIMRFWTVVTALVVVAAIVVGAAFLFWPKYVERIWTDTPFDLGQTIMVEYRSGSPSVQIHNGKIVSREQYTLSFPFSGRVQTVPAFEGQLISGKGGALVQLERTEWELQIKKAEAEYAAAQALVRKLQTGSRFEELVILESRRQSSASGLKGSKQTVIDALTQAFTQADDAVRNYTDVIFTNPETNPQLSFTPTDASLESDIETRRAQIEDTLDDWRSDVGKMKDSGNIAKYIDSGRSKLKAVRTYLDRVGLAVNALTAGAVSQDTIDAWKTAVSTARTAVSEAQVALGESEGVYKVANREVSVAEAELNLRLAGAERQEIEAALSRAVAAESEKEILADQIRHTMLTTPVDNLLVKKILVKPGEFIEAGTPVAIVTDPTLEGEVDIPEEKISGIAPGNRVIVRLNAYPYEDITGLVDRIDPQEIERDGATYFRTHVTLVNVPEKVRMGMLGDVVIETLYEGSILQIPAEAAHVKAGHRLVTVIAEDGTGSERVIESGIERDGWIEVLSGLQSGDVILAGDKKAE